MLVIRMQRTGRKGHAQFRVVVQDSRRTPTSGKVVAQLGHFNPHTKETTLDKDRAATYVKNGAQPSERVARLLKSEGVKLPKWVRITESKKKTTKNPEKLRKNRPAEEVKEAAPVEDAPTEEVSAEAKSAEEAPAIEATEPTDEKPTEEAKPEVPAEDTAAEAETESEETKES